MRIALAQIDPTVGDIPGNTALIVDALAAGARSGADLTLLPEMAVTGYPPEDLLGKEHFVTANIEALDRIAKAGDRAALVGFVDRDAQGLYNAAALIEAGRIQYVYRKRRLPNYGVFDERRYFVAGESDGLFDLGDVRVALTVCEDVWTEDIPSQCAAGGAKLLLNISASPFYAGKHDEREEMLAARARDNGMWLAYCNLVGGQDELVFDGRSVVFSPSGEVVARAEAFGADLLVVDVDFEGTGGAAVTPGRIAESPRAEAEIHSALVLGLRDYVHKNGFSDVTLGLSGGIDSALVAAVAADALGPAHVHGVLMPGPYSSAGSVDDSLALASALGIEAIELPIGPAFKALLETLEQPFAGRAPDIAEENLQARVRGTLLMALSNKLGWLVLATGNKSELSVGYSTLYGDMVGGFAPIRDVLKTRVYELARWRNRDGEVIPAATIDKPPSAELRPDQVDQDSLPPYDVLDAVLAAYVERDMSVDAIVAAGHDRDLVERVARMVDAAEYKRRQGPLGVKITPKAFGRDRRMPVTNRFGG